MFEFIRQHTKIMMSVMFLLIVPAFVLVGVDGYGSFKNNDKVVAVIAGEKLFQAQWDAAHQQEVDRMRASIPNIDAAIFETKEARYNTLERLVRDRVVAKAAEVDKLLTSDARLARSLQQNPTIASFRKPDGKLDMERYKQLAGSQGLTTDGFEARVRDELSAMQVEAGILATSFSVPSVTNIALNAFFEKREIQLAKFEPDSFKDKIKPADLEIEDFYKANSKLFLSAEAADVEYVTLDLPTIQKNIVISDADMRNYYDQNSTLLSGQEERRARHILIITEKNSTNDVKNKALEKAQEILKELRLSPAKFSELAKKNSQDPGSAAKGGDLDYFTRDAMVKPFADAAFSMKTGDISEVVNSDFGYHIIELLDIKKPKQRSFEELRPTIESDLKDQQAKRKFAEMAETFSNTVYEQSDSLEPLTKKLNLAIKKANNILRTPSSKTQGPLSNSKLLASLFSVDSTQKKHNTAAIETGPNELTSARIVRYAPAHTKDLREVKNEVRERIISEKSAEMARAEGKDKLSAWSAQSALAKLPTSVVISRIKAEKISSEVISAVMQTKESEMPIFKGIDLKDRGYAVVKVIKVLARDVPEASVAKQELAQYNQWWSRAENQAYYSMLKERLKVEMKVAKPVALIN